MSLKNPAAFTLVLQENRKFWGTRSVPHQVRPEVSPQPPRAAPTAPRLPLTPPARPPAPQASSRSPPGAGGCGFSAPGTAPCPAARPTGHRARRWACPALGIPAPGPGPETEPWPSKWPRGRGGLWPEGAGCRGVWWPLSGFPGAFPAASKRACVPLRPHRAAGSARFYWCSNSNKRCQLSLQTSSARFSAGHPDYNRKHLCSVFEGAAKI